MKNRTIVFLITFVAISLFGVEKLSAQNDVFSTSVEPIYLDIDANQSTGVRKTFMYTVKFFNAGVNYYDAMNLSVRLNNDIANGIGAVIDPSIIKIELKQIIEGPRKSQVKDTRIFLRKQDQKIAEGKWGTIFNNVSVPAGGGMWTFEFDLIIEERDLKELQNGTYLLNLDFILSLELHYVFGGNRWYNSTATSEGNINVVNYAPSFGFEVNANAILDFTSPEHFTMQVENEPNSSWIDVVSKNSDYFIKVKANDPNFQLVRNDAGYEGNSTIPVSVVNVEMDLGNNRYGQSEGPKSLSSTTAEILFRGKKKQNETQKLPVRYFIKKEDAEMLSTKTSGQYITIVTYTLEPN